MLLGGAFMLMLFQACKKTTSESDEEYKIAILSPNEGPLREVGNLHRKSVRRAFQLEHGKMTKKVQGHTFRFLFLGTGDPVTEATTCKENAKRAKAEDAIAILGPVSSGCTRRVLSQDSIRVPVISSLSTAKNLGDQDRWFFRTIAHDEGRLESFIIYAEDGGMAIDNNIVIYEKSDYGKGLLTHLINLIDGLDSAHTFRWEESLVDTNHGNIYLAESFKHKIQHHHVIKNVFVLGSSDRMVSVIRALDEMFKDQEVKGDPNLIFVGSMPNTEDLPEDTWTIGEPQVRTSRNLITEITSQNPSEDLYLSTFDASIALKEAIQSVFRQPNANTLTLPDIRTKLRNKLAEGNFSSSERHRRVEFTNGEINAPPKTPIYKVSVERHVENVNPDSTKPWVKIRIIEEPTDHLEGPMVVELIPQGADWSGNKVDLQVEGLADAPVTVQTVKLQGDGTRVSFVPSFFVNKWFPNSFSISTDETPIKEHVKIDKLGWPVSYLFAALTALFAALLYGRYKTQQDKRSTSGTVQLRTIRWYVERATAGLVIAFLIIHVAPLLEEAETGLSWIPLPQFGSSVWINAFLSGLLGGWLGLNPIERLVNRVIGRLTPLDKSNT